HRRSDTSCPVVFQTKDLAVDAIGGLRLRCPASAADRDVDQAVRSECRARTGGLNRIADICTPAGSATRERIWRRLSARPRRTNQEGFIRSRFWRELLRAAVLIVAAIEITRGVYGDRMN